MAADIRPDFGINENQYIQNVAKKWIRKGRRAGNMRIFHTKMIFFLDSSSSTTSHGTIPASVFITFGYSMLANVEWHFDVYALITCNSRITHTNFEDMRALKFQHTIPNPHVHIFFIRSTCDFIIIMIYASHVLNGNVLLWFFRTNAKREKDG